MIDDPELLAAQRDAALRSLAALIDLLQRIGGYHTMTDQIAMREARAVLEECR